MSLSVTSLLVYGWPIDVQIVTKKETRYNELTGEPYDIDVETDDRRIVIDGSHSVIIHNDDLCDEEDVNGLAITDQYYEPYKGTKANFIGVITRLPYDYSHVKVEPLTKDEQKFLDEMAVKVGSKPSYHLVGYVS